MKIQKSFSVKSTDEKEVQEILTSFLRDYKHDVAPPIIFGDGVVMSIQIWSPSFENIFDEIRASRAVWIKGKNFAIKSVEIGFPSVHLPLSFAEYSDINGDIYSHVPFPLISKFIAKNNKDFLSLKS